MEATAEVKEFTSNLKVDDKKRITNWLYSTDIPFLEKKKDQVENSGKKCEILFSHDNKNTKVFALFFSEGYYEWNEKKNEAVFILTK